MERRREGNAGSAIRRRSVEKRELIGSESTYIDLIPRFTKKKSKIQNYQNKIF